MISLLNNFVLDQEIRWWEHTVWNAILKMGSIKERLKKETPHIYKSELYLS